MSGRTNLRILDTSFEVSLLAQFTTEFVWEEEDDDEEEEEEVDAELEIDDTANELGP